MTGSPTTTNFPNNLPQYFQYDAYNSRPSSPEPSIKEKSKGGFFNKLPSFGKSSKPKNQKTSFTFPKFGKKSDGNVDQKSSSAMLVATEDANATDSAKAAQKEAAQILHVSPNTDNFNEAYKGFTSRAKKRFAKNQRQKPQPFDISTLSTSEMLKPCTKLEKGVSLIKALSYFYNKHINPEFLFPEDILITPQTHLDQAWSDFRAAENEAENINEQFKAATLESQKRSLSADLTSKKDEVNFHSAKVHAYTFIVDNSTDATKGFYEFKRDRGAASANNFADNNSGNRETPSNNEGTGNSSFTLLSLTPPSRLAHQQPWNDVSNQVQLWPFATNQTSTVNQTSTSSTQYQQQYTTSASANPRRRLPSRPERPVNAESESAGNTTSTQNAAIRLSRYMQENNDQEKVAHQIEKILSPFSQTQRDEIMRIFQGLSASSQFSTSTTRSPYSVPPPVPPLDRTKYASPPIPNQHPTAQGSEQTYERLIPSDTSDEDEDPDGTATLAPLSPRASQGAPHLINGSIFSSPPQKEEI